MEKSSDKKTAATSVPQTLTSQLVTLPLQLKSFFGYNKFKKIINQGQALGDEKVQGNFDMIAQEIESLQMILTDKEIEVFDSMESDKVETSDDSERSKLMKMIKLSLVPKIPECVKFYIKDVPKDVILELRSLPPLELFILLPDSYPSNSGPLFLMPNT